jgi:spermidine synthase
VAVDTTASSSEQDVRIGEDGGRTALLVDGVVQSISPEDGLQTGGYWAAMVPNDQRPRQALILGLGGGTVARLLQTRWGDVSIVGVDDDPAIVAVARQAGWLPSDGLEVVTDDAFHFVQTCDRQFDYIAVDLFRGEVLARRSFGKPFLRQLTHLLEPHGRLVVNLFRDRRETARIERLATYFDIRQRLGVGGNVVVHAASRGRR